MLGALEGHGPAVADVVREVDGRHAPGAELALDAVTVGEGRVEAGDGVVQGAIRAGAGRTLPVTAGNRQAAVAGGVQG